MPTSPYPLALPEDLQEEIRLTAESTGLTQAEAMRQGLRLGLPSLRRKLHRPAPRLTNVEPWPVKVLTGAWKRQERHWDSIEGAAARAQPRPRLDD